MRKATPNWQGYLRLGEFVAGTVDTKTATVTNLDAKQSNSLDESVGGLYFRENRGHRIFFFGEAEIAAWIEMKPGASSGRNGKRREKRFCEDKSRFEKLASFCHFKTMLDQPLVVTEVLPGEGFKVAIKSPSDENIKFAWWVVDQK